MLQESQNEQNQMAIKTIFGKRKATRPKRIFHH